MYIYIFTYIYTQMKSKIERSDPKFEAILLLAALNRVAVFDVLGVNQLGNCL